MAAAWIAWSLTAARNCATSRPKKVRDVSPLPPGATAWNTRAEGVVEVGGASGMGPGAGGRPVGPAAGEGQSIIRRDGGRERTGTGDRPSRSESSTEYSVLLLPRH